MLHVHQKLLNRSSVESCETSFFDLKERLLKLQNREMGFRVILVLFLAGALALVVRTSALRVVDLWFIFFKPKDFKNMVLPAFLLFVHHEKVKIRSPSLPK